MAAEAAKLRQLTTGNVATVDLIATQAEQEAAAADALAQQAAEAAAAAKRRAQAAKVAQAEAARGRAVAPNSNLGLSLRKLFQVICPDVWIREEPSLNAESVIQVQQGDKVEVTSYDERRTWARIVTNTSEGEVRGWIPL